MQTSLPFEETRTVYSVSEVTRDLKELLEDSFHSLWISGEVSNFKRAASGHLYFTLKDHNAQMRAVLFRGSASQLKFQLEDGLQILAHGRLSVYEPRGEYQIILDTAEPEGVGALQLAYEQLKKKLDQEGLFDQKHKQPLPFLPRKVGVITSAKGAAVHDIQEILQKRFPGIGIVIIPATVQGDQASHEISMAIERAHHHEGIDVLIVGRGGGSLEDLWAFNEERTVRAIFRATIPVISAVGHQTDFTLADFVADARAATPTAAAEMAVPDKSELVDQLASIQREMKEALVWHVEQSRERVQTLSKRLKDPRSILDGYLLRIDDFQLRMIHALKIKLMEAKNQHSTHKQSLIQFPHRLEKAKLRLKMMTTKLEALSPTLLFQKGWAMVTQQGVFNPLDINDKINIDDILDLHCYQGAYRMRVIEKL